MKASSQAILAHLVPGRVMLEEIANHIRRRESSALNRAAQRALELGRRTHTPVWVVRDGVLVDLTREEPASSEEDSDAAAPCPQAK